MTRPVKGEGLMSRARDRRGGAVRAARSLSACSSLAVGVFGWLVAHLLTLLLLAYSHGGALSLTGQRLHDYTTAAALLAGCVAAISLLTMPVSASSPRRSSLAPPRRGEAVRSFATMSTTAFLVAQLAEQTILDGFRMPPAILLSGVLVHALFGAASGLTWHHYHDVVHRLWSPTRPTPASPTPLPFRSTSAWNPCRPVFGSCVTGRAPPAIVTG